MEPRIHQFAGGWAASGNGFATFASTREEALERYRRSAPTCEAAGCEDEPAFELGGIPLCANHYDNVTARAGAAGSTDRSPVRALVERPTSQERLA